MKKVCLCIPTLTKPYPQMIDSLEAEVPFLEEAGWTHTTAWEVGDAYISHARSSLLSKALKWETDRVFYIDHDLQWKPGALTKVLATKGDVVGGTYRLKSPEEEYMGLPVVDEADRPKVREADGAIEMYSLPAGFLSLSATAIEIFIRKYHYLNFSREGNPFCYDIFNHGAIKGTWFGEDYAFCLRWKNLGFPIYCVPDLDITHWHYNADGELHEFPGNYHEYLMRRPLGAKWVYPHEKSADRAPRDRESSLEMHVCSKETEDGTGSRHVHGEVC